LRVGKDGGGVINRPSCMEGAQDGLAVNVTTRGDLLHSQRAQSRGLKNSAGGGPKTAPYVEVASRRGKKQSEDPASSKIVNRAIRFKPG